MQNVALIVLVVSLFLGLCLFQKSRQHAGMTPVEKVRADRQRAQSYALFGIAVAAGVYYYYLRNNSQEAQMCGMRAHMCGRVY